MTAAVIPTETLSTESRAIRNSRKPPGPAYARTRRLCPNGRLMYRRRVFWRRGYSEAARSPRLCRGRGGAGDRGANSRRRRGSSRRVAEVGPWLEAERLRALTQRL